jgi:hypothetical protein
MELHYLTTEVWPDIGSVVTQKIMARSTFSQQKWHRTWDR